MTKKRVILALIAVAVVVVAWFIFKPKADSVVAPKWITSEVTSQSIRQSITATGTIEPVTLVDVGTQVSGILTTLYVDYNSVVKKGQIIAELDKSTLQLDLDTNKNNLAEAVAHLEYVESSYNRTKALYEKGLVSDSEYEESLYSYRNAVASLGTAKNNVERSEINLGYATIYSPIDGVVLTRDVEEGQTVASSFSTPTLFTVAADLTDMRVIADIDEADIGNVKEGQRASFTVDAFPDDIFDGVVTQVRQQATIESNVVTYEVVISAANPDLKLMPGLTASVEVFTVDVDCEFVVPAAALTFDPGFEMPEIGEAGDVPPPPAHIGENSIEINAMVWVLVGEMIEPRPVYAGFTNGILTEVEGVRKSDIVVIGSEFIPTLPMGGGAPGTTNPFVQQRPGGRR